MAAVKAQNLVLVLLSRLICHVYSIFEQLFERQYGYALL
jgi:hypothetical protein